jgi:hypothetical protein
MVGSLVFADCGSNSFSPTGPTSWASGTVLWSADHETGDLSQWYRDGGGGEFNSGAASSSASQDVAHSGRFSAKGTISTPGASGVRLFRWRESRANVEAYYSVWFYFPRVYAPGWWDIFQFKSRNETIANDPFWFLQVTNRSSTAMSVFLYWWNGLSIEGPRRGEFGGRSFSQALKDVLVDSWTHIEVFLRQSSGFDGRIIVWQDGVELFNLSNVRTRYPSSNGANEWAVTNYGDGIVPSPTTIYFDDAAISTSRLGP